MNDIAYTDAELAELDRVARQIDIDAPAARVWDLVVRPGWYINEGEVDPEPDLSYEGDVAVVRGDRLGEFRFSTVELDKPRYAAFRWLTGRNQQGAKGSTLVEFWIDERPGGVTLRVVESGFSRLFDERSAWLKEREGNDVGWAEELAAGKRYVEKTAAAAPRS
ncbi:ATPase [Streptomyces sp. NBC_01808]|uniref:SRPBCC domain-containing protein n=1 Tax=Streptomyces sp. NBC_01808 TaxID=2975947 RepID=UPI002DDB5A01|nr:SRPBCC domain-containing protein [Streptomyces sp. NBC_01808]WSA38836.1 ATPase [Streptomyces sp. NBC_01808]